ncbi:MAG: hypothetical protein JJE47_01725 [Acidimicrobiia bacterium]|nr:hypothetical protein [Acidimicrobiia bacterium]
MARKRAIAVAIRWQQTPTHTAMMAHGGDAHANLMEGKTDAEMMQKKAEMDAHIKKLIEQHN